MICIHVLPEKRDFPDAPSDQPLRLFPNPAHRAAGLRPPCVRNDAERAELVAPLLNRQECRRVPPPDGGTAGKPVELALRRELRVNLPVAFVGTLDEVRQAVVGLRPDHDIHHRLPPDDLLALGLGHATGNDNPQVGIGFLEPLVATKFGIDLLRCLLTDVAGVEHDHVGVVDVGGLREPGCCQRVRHPLAVIDIHLTAVGLDEGLLRHRTNVP